MSVRDKPPVMGAMQGLRELAGRPEHVVVSDCYQVAAFKGELESARSAPGCVDAGLSNETAGPVLVPQPKPQPPPITIQRDFVGSQKV